MSKRLSRLTLIVGHGRRPRLLDRHRVGEPERHRPRRTAPTTRPAARVTHVDDNRPAGAGHGPQGRLSDA